jgi:activator of HSP90 ATPase
MKDATAATNRLSRRQALAGVAFALGSMTAGFGAWAAAPQKKMEEAQSSGAEALLTYLHQEISFPASPQRIYEALMDSKQFAAFTGMPAQISREAGGAFTTFGGLVVGRNVELAANQRIVQAWRPVNWDPGVYSLVKFELQQQGSQTTIVLDHTGFPEGAFRHLNSGWYQRYWDPLRKFLA